MAELLAEYINGNYIVKIYDDGTKIRECTEDTLRPTFPENIDLKISDRCKGGCEFCHENSTPNGPMTDFNYEFLYSLHSGTELAIGGGNIFEVENLEALLYFCKDKGVIANITVNQKHLARNRWAIFSWLADELVHGVGVSFTGDADELDNLFKDGGWDDNIRFKPNFVIHVINGVHSFDQIMTLANRGYKLLILGYKDCRRGIDYRQKHDEQIIANQRSIYDNIHTIMKSFDVVSFDNLAIEQLNVRRLFTTEEWNEFYMGDDGRFTMYIDMVKGEFAMNSTAQERYPVLPTVDEMFAALQKPRD